MPARTDFDVGVLRPWLGNLALIDIPSNMIRLCGTNLMSRFGVMQQDANRLAG
jgi:hypothetical protein